MRLSNDIWDWLSFCRGSNSEKCETTAKWHLSSVEALPSAKFWKRENGLTSWTEWNTLIDFWVILILRRSGPRNCEMSFSSVEVLPSSKFWKNENGPISWIEWNIVMKFCRHIGIDKMLWRLIYAKNPDIQTRYNSIVNMHFFLNTAM